MSKKKWYKRKHEFTPYTKADGQAVSDEFDSIQASFELIPEMRDDGKGFEESPLIPEPTDPMHPVPLKMLTETEKSVNNARDDVTAKAQQVAQDAQSVAANTLTTTQKANTATQAAELAQGSQQVASDSENMARKWASNPVDEVVQDNRYSAFHYATKAAESATGLASAEASARSNAEIATQKADEAKKAADKARSIANGEVEFNKVLNVPSANTRQEGIVQLTSATDSDSEELGLTARAGKKLAESIAAVQADLGDYIPNSNKSDAVDNQSPDDVASSVAVKKAYDKAVEADDNADGRVSKSGDSMTGALSNNHSGAGAYANQFTSGAPFLVSEEGSIYHDAYHPFLKGRVRKNGEYGVAFSLGYTTKQGEGDGFGNGIIHLITDAGASRYWQFGHDGSFYSEFGDIRTATHSLNRAHQTDYDYVTVTENIYNLAGVNIQRNNGKLARFELIGGRWKFWLQDMYDILMPEKGGVVALVEDFTYQRIGDFEIRRYPDGTMIQTFFAEFNDVNAPRAGIGSTGQKQLNWAVSFVEKPMVFGNITTSLHDPHDVGVNIITGSTNTTLYWFNYEHSNANQGLCRLQFLAIGRWK